MKVSIQPCGFKVLVKAEELETMSEGGIHLPILNEKLAEASQEKGTLVAVGPLAWNGEGIRTDDGKVVAGRPWAKVGDVVWYSKYAGKFVNDPDSGERYVLMNDDDISAVYVGDAA